MALDRQLSAISVTDHDTVAGVDVAVDASKGTDLEVVPGVEIGTLIESQEVHLLGYFIATDSRRLREALALLRRARLERAREIVDRLIQLDVRISLQQVAEIVGEAEAIGRPHIAHALVKEGVVPSSKEAFDRYLSPGAPAYVPRYRMPPQDVLALIRDAHGIAVIAHPLEVLRFVPQLVDYGLVGLEAFYRGYTPGQISELLNLAHRYNLVPTGGTDFHGSDRDDAVAPGSVYVPPNTVERLRERLRTSR